MSRTRVAKFKIGQVVRHRLFPFRGVVFDIDPEFDNTEEWYQSIPAEVRPRKDQPFYHLFAENAETEYIAMFPSRIFCLIRRASRCATRRSPKCSSGTRRAATGRAIHC
jgi:heat shock protein HspQ